MRNQSARRTTAARAGVTTWIVGLLILFAGLLAARPAHADAPRVVASIVPLHSLVAGVMKDVDAPHLLIRGGTSPHHHALRPSQARALADADAVFWIGEPVEHFLIAPLGAAKARVVALLEAPDVHVLPAREGGTWETGGNGHDHDHGHGHGHEDGHIWLDPRNAVAIAGTVAQVLAEADPENAIRYRENAHDLAARLAALEKELATTLATVRQAPYVVFHDAYQYLETRFGLNAVGAISVHTGRAPGASRLRELRREIVDSGVKCVFREPQFEPKLAQTITEGTGAAVDVLDPLGADVPPGEDAYFTLMRRIAESLVTCLSRNP